MFKKVERLNQSEFSDWFKSGKRHNFTYFTIITKQNSSLKVGWWLVKKWLKVRLNEIYLKDGFLPLYVKP